MIPLINNIANHGDRKGGEGEKEKGREYTEGMEHKSIIGEIGIRKQALVKGCVLEHYMTETQLSKMFKYISW